MRDLGEKRKEKKGKRKGGRKAGQTIFLGWEREALYTACALCSVS
jgi:hypothetical protein